MTRAHCTHTYVLQYFCKSSRRRLLLLNCSECMLGPKIRIWAFFLSSLTFEHRVITCIYFAARLQTMTCAWIELHSWAGTNPPSAPACFGHLLSTKRSQWAACMAAQHAQVRAASHGSCMHLCWNTLHLSATLCACFSRSFSCSCLSLFFLT